MSDESVNHGTKILLEASASKKDTKSPGMIDSGLGKQLGVIEATQNSCIVAQLDSWKTVGCD